MTTHTANTPKLSTDESISPLMQQPALSWITISLFITITVSFISATLLAINGEIPITYAMIVNAIVVYIAYTIVHEAAHGLVCSNRIMNRVIGTIALSFITITPFFSTYRFLHLTHHKYINDPEKDPDYFCGSGPKWMLPFRWMVMDMAYVTNYFTMGYYTIRPTMEKVEFWVSVMFGSCVLAAIITHGYLVEFILLYFIPTRIGLLFLALLFDYLPHYPHSITNQQNRFQATNNRVGLEWLLTPLFLGQNYHLTHHLYPNVPFYRYRKLWLAKSALHKSSHPAEVKFYKLTPENNRQS